MAMIGKEIWIVWSIEGDDEYFSTKAKAYARCVELVNEIMCDDAEERAECLLELAEYNEATDLCGFYSDFIDKNEDEKEVPKGEPKGSRPMKYHIYNSTMDVGTPLCIDDAALEFDNYDAAVRFCYSAQVNTGFDLTGVMIKEDVLCYDGGYLDATNKIIDSEGELVDVTVS